jgi:hypothetical protein
MLAYVIGRNAEMLHAIEVLEQLVSYLPISVLLDRISLQCALVAL